MRRRTGALRGLVAGAVALLSLAFASTASADSFIVLYKGSAVPASAKTDVQKAGGTFVHGYNQIGVAIARSNSRTFANKLARDKRIEGVSSTRGFASKLQEPSAKQANGPKPGEFPNSPASDSDTFSPFQWDMRQIHTPEAHEITGGSPAVVVGDIDTGLDYRHPDLRQNVSDADSANCLSGAPVQGAAAADDDNGHGTHTAGTIAAASNGIGIVGVAPNVKVAGIKAGNADGYFFPEAVICSFMWAGNRQLDVTNNSYFADPWEYNCRNDPEQRAIWKAEQRAIRYAQSRGVLVVASAGNDSDDVSHPTRDVTSPDFPPGSEQERRITNACVVVPLEVSGVVGVSATGPSEQDTHAGQYVDNLKSFYSSYGVSVVDVTAPGGDSIFNDFDPPVQGRVLSTWPAAVIENCLPERQRQEPTPDPSYGVVWYCYQQGTSMASPHAAGVAALIVSMFGDMSPGRIASFLSRTADPQACPNSLPEGYLDFTGFNSGEEQECQGGPGHNSWYGNGQVDALNAVTGTSGG
jgi:lantibiotic leader peptide-processing serine protease